MKEFLKSKFGLESITHFYTIAVLLVLGTFAWMAFGMIAFALIFQWIILLIFPKELWTPIVYSFVSLWTIFGIWYWIFKVPNEKD